MENINKKHSYITVLPFLFFLIIGTNCMAQVQYNLVPNYSFDQYSVCPTTIENARSDKPDFWYKPDLRGARYFNACANGFANNHNGMPINFLGGGYNFQYAKTGNGYILMFYYNGMDARNYIQVKLIDSLRQGKCYYAEYYVNSQNSINLACNNQAMLFTNNPVYVDTAALQPVYLLPANPQIQNPYIITDTVNWVKVGGVFTAQGGEQYLTLGNFKNNAQTQIQQIQTTGYYGAAYYLEDVIVIPLDSITLKADAGADRTINLGDSTFIGSYLTGLTNVNWFNSTGNVIATNVSGLFVKPAASTFYVVEQNICGQYSRDTVNVNVNTIVPLTFTIFSVKKSLNQVYLNWTTTHESNVAHFNIQQSLNGVNFNDLHKQPAKNNRLNNYSYTDAISINNKKFYRLQAVDKDGKITYSKTVLVDANYNDKTIIYPNPASDFITVVSNNLRNITITDLDGRQIKTFNCNNTTSTKIDISSLSKGIYMLKLIHADNSSETQKLIINKNNP
jgi:hypothetical protein